MQPSNNGLTNMSMSIDQHYIALVTGSWVLQHLVALSNRIKLKFGRNTVYQQECWPITAGLCPDCLFSS